MGPRIPAAALTLRGCAPRPASLRLLRDGEPVAIEDPASHVAFDVREPGVYRLEAPPAPQRARPNLGDLQPDLPHLGGYDAADLVKSSRFGAGGQPCMAAVEVVMNDHLHLPTAARGSMRLADGPADRLDPRADCAAW